MGAIFVDFEQLNSFLFGLEHFKEGITNRFELVAEYVRSDPKEPKDLSSSASLKVSLGGSEKRKSSKQLNLTKKSNCKTVYKLLLTKYPLLLERDFQKKNCIQARYHSSS